jgi:hypothetical protein
MKKLEEYIGFVILILWFALMILLAFWPGR